MTGHPFIIKNHMYKFISWNVNGLRAVCGKGFADIFADLDADFFCLQETKLQAGQIKLELPGYEQYWNYAEKKGYSGTAIFAREEAISFAYGLGIPELDTEGRMITLEYDNFPLPLMVNVPQYQICQKSAWTPLEKYDDNCKIFNVIVFAAPANQLLLNVFISTLCGI